MDGKEVRGAIKYILYKDDKPRLVYVQDVNNNDTVPLKPSTVHAIDRYMSKAQNVGKGIEDRPYLVDHDYQAFSPVGESKTYKR